MMQAYTTDQTLIQYFYNELSITDRLETEYALDEDSTLKARYSDLTSQIAKMPKVNFFPRERVVRSILQYSMNEA